MKLNVLMAQEDDLQMIEEAPLRLLIGTDYPILQKVGCAQRLFRVFGQNLLSDSAIRSLLENYRQTVRQSSAEMKRIGVIAECTDCAVNDGGSCCGNGIENRFDVVLLLINLLMGSELPLLPWDETGCWFLGPSGCLILARHVMCVNYICRRLNSKIEKLKINSLQQKIVVETNAGFALEEGIKKWLRNKGL